MEFNIKPGTEYKRMSAAEKAETAELAETLKQALVKLTQDPEKLDAFTGYLERHFFAWMVKYAADPYGLTFEIKRFSED